MRFFPLVFIIILFSSCLNEPDCVITSSNEVKISLIQIGKDTARKVIFDSIRVTGTDSLFHVSDTVTEVKLRVDPRVTETLFTFYYESKVDSLTLAYNRKTRVISPACGAFNYFYDLHITLSTFPEATVTNAELSTSTATNVKIRL